MTMRKKDALRKRPKANPKVLGRVLKMLFGYYPVLAPIIVVCILISAVTAALPAVFMQQVIAAIEKAQLSGASFAEASGEIVKKVLLLATFYVVHSLHYLFDRKELLIACHFLYTVII